MAPAFQRLVRINLLGLLTALLAAAALFLFVYVLPQHLSAMARTYASRRATGVAAVMANAVAPALEFDDRERVSELLAGFSGSPEVIYAWVRREDGSLLASWPHDRALDLGLRPHGEPIVVQQLGALHVIAEVQGRGGTRGTLGIGFSMAELERQERQNMWLVGSGGATVFALGLALALFTRAVGRRRKSAEEALARTETSFRALIERNPEAMAVYRDGYFVYVNPAMVRYLGYDSADELMGQPAHNVVVPDERKQAAEVMKQLVETEEPVGPFEVRLMRKNGSIVTAEIVGLSLVVDGQRSQVGIARDLTERQQLTARMMQMDRLVAVGTLAAGVAHEINNPLSFVIGNTDWMDRKIAEVDQHLQAAKDGVKTGEELKAVEERLQRFRQVLEETRAGAERVRVIVRDLKTLSRAEDEKRGPVALEPVVESAVQMAWNEIRHRAQLVKEYAPVPKVIGNEGRLGQVFLNLLINAAQSITEGHADQNRITLRIGMQDGRVFGEVQDTGVGMTPDVVQRVFDPFFTTKPQGHGTGLGLSICQSIVQAMGGEIHVESAPGKGSSFRVLLPVSHAADTPLRATPVAVPKGKRGRILVVDDEPLVGTSLRRSLEEEHEVTVATSAREALGRLAGGERYDVILCDVMMPDITGYELYEELFQYAPDQARRMIFLTGGAFTPKAREFLGKVQNKRVEKPFDIERVRGLVRLMVK